MHVGLIGTGRIGALHARSLRGSPLVSKLSIFDSDSNRAAKVAGEVSASLAESPQALVADASVATFCEKPIALDLAATDEVIRHVQQAGIFVQIGFQRRFDAGYRS